MNTYAFTLSTLNQYRRDAAWRCQARGTIPLCTLPVTWTASPFFTAPELKESPYDRNFQEHRCRASAR
jgi:hypothetical protein